MFQGLKVSAYYGNFFIRSTDLLALPSIDSDKGFAVQFAHSDNNVGTKYASFQTALLYTTSGIFRVIKIAHTFFSWRTKNSCVYKLFGSHE
jgi:protein transport protein SEC24